MPGKEVLFPDDMNILWLGIKPLTLHKFSHDNLKSTQRKRRTLLIKNDWQALSRLQTWNGNVNRQTMSSALISCKQISKKQQQQKKKTKLGKRHERVERIGRLQTVKLKFEFAFLTRSGFLLHPSNTFRRERCIERYSRMENTNKHK